MRRLVTPVGLMLALTFATGVVDAVGRLSAGAALCQLHEGLAVAAAALVVLAVTVLGHASAGHPTSTTGLAVPGLAAITADIPRKKAGRP
ncbi:hypothetical protein EDC02_3084 [Micromonospora sp. Llam0]|uniref:hypothetical protein n=1 Tax=Micromonospora sp. Llam0 TaxID=2485143 RepID=UPI000FAA1D6C|nr:hypothetical protein [Micromonospora sp. Llam0]ROO61154.1 hypothetical protein EDC02_3084 [Micromonospora sp. Llam0]